MGKRLRDNERMPTLEQISAGGVAFRRIGEGEPGSLEIALILVGPQGRWQLPKGLVNAGETPETAALREVAEEAGIETALVEPIDVIEYWYYDSRGAQKVRYHKKVHFFLLEYVAGMTVRSRKHAGLNLRLPRKCCRLQASARYWRKPIRC